VYTPNHTNITLAPKAKISENGEYDLSSSRYHVSSVPHSVYPIIKIENAINKVTYTNKIKTADYLELGKYPIIDQSDTFIAGYWNTESDVFRISKPVTIFGDHTRCVKYVNFDFVLGADGVKILEPIDEFDPKLFYYFVKHSKVKNLGYSRHFKELKELQIPLPPLEVQKEIVAEIESYQKIIDGARIVVENYKPRLQIDPKWPKVALNTVCQINPQKSEISDLSDSLEVSFVPMSIINENDIQFKPNEIKQLKEVFTGYTYFKDNDILLAKVTPCFENGKAGIAKNLENSIGFGSSELFVLRSFKNVKPQWLYFNIIRDEFRADGKQRMTGTGGLQRVPKDFIGSYIIPLPDLAIQEQIISDIENELDIIEKNKEIVTIFEQKIKDRIAAVWNS
jgi:restriction endonuclease S subunit